MTSDVHDCPLCGTNTSTSICANCASDLDALGVELIDPDATREQVLAWAKEKNITVFACKKAGGP